MNTLQTLATVVGDRLRQRGETVTTAESCTGGMIASALTSVPGSSAWFGYGFVTYSNEAKQRLLSVPESTLTTYGAVSAETALAMAQGALTATSAQWSIAVTGIAGPEGGSESKPVGTVWFALGYRGAPALTFVHYLPGQRDQVRSAAVTIALQRLANELM